MDIKSIKRQILGEHKNSLQMYFVNFKGFWGRFRNKEEYWDKLDAADMSTTEHNLSWKKDWKLTEQEIDKLSCFLKMQSAKLKLRSDFILFLGAFLAVWAFAFLPEQKIGIAFAMTLAFVERFNVLQKIYENEIVLEAINAKV